MQTFSELLDALRDRAGSDRKAAVQLGISQNAFSIWRRGGHPEDDQAAKIAAALDLDAAYVFAIVRAARAKSPTARATWQRIAEQFGKAATVAVLAIGAASFGMPSPAQANFTFAKLGGGSAPNSGANATGIHIVRNPRRRRRGPWAQLMELVR